MKWFRDPRCSPRGNPACRGTIEGRRKAVRDRFALQGEEVHQHSHQGHSGSPSRHRVRSYSASMASVPRHVQATKPPSFPHCPSKVGCSPPGVQVGQEGDGAARGQNRACGRMWPGAMLYLAHTDLYKISKLWTCKNQDSQLHIKLARAKLIRGCTA